MRIISYNVNGIRAALKKGLIDWLKAASPDVLCLQEIKASPEQVNLSLFEKEGYVHQAWFPAQKKGYSGVAMLSKIKPLAIEKGCGIPLYDDEGRVLRADFGPVSILNVYMPSGSSGEHRQAVKMQWLSDFYSYAGELQKKTDKLVIAGDYNICHRPIDIHNPVSNAKSSGFLPEERAWMDQFISSGFIDSFRYFDPEPHRYTWWSSRTNARERNLGWRIDYQMVSKNLEKHMKRAAILPAAVHSDHCPVLLELNFK